MVESTTGVAEPPSAPETTTVPAAVKRLRIGRNQAYKAAANGELPAIRIRRRLLVLTARSSGPAPINTAKTSGRRNRTVRKSGSRRMR
jgi:hypothetical protein